MISSLKSYLFITVITVRLGEIIFVFHDHDHFSTCKHVTPINSIHFYFYFSHPIPHNKNLKYVPLSGISACVDNRGKEYGHLESWSPDPCTECECLVDENTGDKEEVCSMMDCPDPGKCDRRIITPPDQCCPIC